MVLYTSSSCLLYVYKNKIYGQKINYLSKMASFKKIDLKFITFSMSFLNLQSDVSFHVGRTQPISLVFR